MTVTTFVRNLNIIPYLKTSNSNPKWHTYLERKLCLIINQYGAILKSSNYKQKYGINALKLYKNNLIIKN